MLSDLEKDYDFILIDTPPVLAVTDASVIGKMAGSIFVVLRHGGHTLGEIDESIKRLKMAGGTVRGVVMNAVERNVTGYGYYRYGYYQYKYD